MTDEPSAGVLIERVTHMNCAQCGTRMDVSALETFAIAQCPSCGDQDSVPGRFGEFLLLNLINVGGMGAVYRARDESLGRLVAIKVMLAKLGEDVEFVENFKREAQAAARLNHPNVAQIYSYGQNQGQSYIVMELVSGHRFDRLIESHPDGLEPGLVLRVAMEIAEGLKAADEIGLIHGDIKPENILLDEKRKAKLVDFGIASFVDQAASEGIWGSPYYIAPEKARGRKSDARSDIYSLGATLYHALAGRPPFDGETPLDVVKARLNGDPVPLGELRPELPKSIVECVARMLQRDPAQRHPTYASLIGDFRRGLQDVAAAGGPSLRVGATGRRVVIRKKDGLVAGPSHFAGTPSGVHRGAAGTLLASVPSLEERTEAMRVSRRRRRVVLSVVAVLALVLVVSWGVFNRVQARQREWAQRREALALQQSIARALVVCDTLDRGATNVVRLAARIAPLLAQVQSAEREIVALFPADTPVPVEAAPPVVPEAAEAKEEAAPGPRKDEAGREAPFGAPAVTKPALEPAEAEPAEAAVDAPARDDHPLAGPLTAIREARVKLEALQQVAVAAVERVARAQRAGAIMRSGLVAAASMDTVVLKERELRDQQAEVARQERALSDLVTEAQGVVDGVSVQVSQAKEAAAQMRQQVEAQRVAEARAALEAKEAAVVADLANRGREHLRGWRYAEAKTLCTTVGSSVTLDASKAQIAAIADRVERIDGLRRFLVKELSRAPYPWGWVWGGGRREDVLGADERKGVALRSRVVPWEQVPVGQYLALVEHCVERPSVRRSMQGEQLLALALFCFEHGGDEAAVRYRDRALSLSPHLEKDAKRLLPLP